MAYEPPKKPDTIRVVGICGSVRKGSYTRKALAVALRGAAETGAHTELLDLIEYKLLFAGVGEGAAGKLGLALLRSQVKAADGIILGTPGISWQLQRRAEKRSGPDGIRRVRRQDAGGWWVCRAEKWKLSTL